MSTKYCMLGLVFLLLPIVPAAAAVPGGGVLVWGSNRSDGRHEVYIKTLPDGAIKRLTTLGGTYPTWSPDGKWIAYHNTQAGVGHLVRPDGSGDHKICDGYPMFWMHDGSGLVCHEKTAASLVDPVTGKSSPFYSMSQFPGLVGKEFEPRGVTHNGRYLLGWSDSYRNGHTGTNGTFKAFQAAVILDLQDNSKIYFFGEGCEPTTPPVGDLIYHVRGDGPTEPDIYRMSTNDLATRSSYQPEMAHPDHDWGHEYNPTISNDNQWLVYVATTDGCHDQDQCDYEVFIHRLGAVATDRTRLTFDSGNDQWPHLHIKSPLPPPDGGGITPDGGPTPDGGSTTSDSGLTPDGGGSKGPESSGCSLGGRGSTSTLLVLLLLGLCRRRATGTTQRPRPGR